MCGGRPFGRPCAGWRAGTHTYVARVNNCLWLT